MRRVAVAFLLAAAAAGCSATIRAPAASAIPAILAADNGTFSGHSELAFIEQQFVREATLNVAECQQVSVGQLTFNNPVKVKRVMLAYTGIGAVSAANCVQALLRLEAQPIKFILWTGTSGQSSSIGGPFDSSCKLRAEDPSTPQRPLALGSVCVTATTFNVFCGLCNGLEVRGSAVQTECGELDCGQQTNVALAGPCNFQMNTSLLDDIRPTIQPSPLLSVPADLQALMQKWWDASLANASDSARAAFVLPTQPTVFTNCATSVSGSLIVPSVPVDSLCRRFGARLLGVSPNETVCFADMEDIGVAQTISAVAAATGTEVPIAFFRGGSNYDHLPLGLVAEKAAGGALAWRQKFDYLNASTLQVFNELGYKWAIETTNTLVLQYLHVTP